MAEWLKEQIDFAKQKIANRPQWMKEAMKNTMIPEKPLFFPLNAEHYDRFASGEKDTEYRAYGSRWNERTCRIGRAATLSRGYGKQNRLHGTVKGFAKIHRNLAPDVAQAIYPNDEYIAAIGIATPTSGGDSHE